ncbi:MAG: zinc ABC transporter substrate-binding protein AztC [Microbacteriaceae bacterium]
MSAARRTHAARHRPRSAVALAGLAAVAAGVALSGCASPASDRPLIAVTTNILGDVVGELVGDQAEVMTLMPPNADPHSFEVSAREAAQLADAQLLVSNGLGLEEGVQRHVDAAAAGGVPAVAAGDLIDPVSYVDEDAGEVDDPHLWTDPLVMIEVVDGLAEAIGREVDGLDADRLEAAAAAYRAELEQLDADLETQFAGIPDDRRSLVTNHHVFGYLAERYDFEVVGAVVPSGTTLAAPSASDLDGLATAIREAGVPAIFVDSSQPARLAEVLAAEAGVDVEIIGLFTESLSGPDEEASTYLDMMRSNGERITAALGR